MQNLEHFLYSAMQRQKEDFTFVSVFPASSLVRDIFHLRFLQTAKDQALLQCVCWFYFFKNVLRTLKTPQALQKNYSNLLCLPENFSILSFARVNHVCTSQELPLKWQTKYFGEVFPFYKHRSQITHEYYVLLQLRVP